MAYKFWWDGREICLKEAFPWLFSLAPHKNATVANMWKGRGGEGQWLVHFRRPFQNWESDGVSQFLELIYMVKLSDEGENFFVQKEERKEVFSVKLFYSSMFADSSVDYPADEI